MIVGRFIFVCGGAGTLGVDHVSFIPSQPLYIILNTAIQPAIVSSDQTPILACCDNYKYAKSLARQSNARQ